MLTKLTVEPLVPNTEDKNVINISQGIILSGKDISRPEADKKKLNFEFCLDMHAMQTLSEVEDGLQEFYDMICSSMTEMTNMGLRRSMTEPGKKVTIYREPQVTSVIFNNHLHFSMNNVDRTIVE